MLTKTDFVFSRVPGTYIWHDLKKNALSWFLEAIINLLLVLPLKYCFIHCLCLSVSLPVCQSVNLSLYFILTVCLLVCQPVCQLISDWLLVVIWTLVVSVLTSWCFRPCIFSSSPPSWSFPVWSPESLPSNSPFPSSPKPLHQSEAWCTTIHMKMSLICIWMKSHFHMKGWAPRLALRKRFKEIRKWPISRFDKSITTIFHFQIQN